MPLTRCHCGSATVSGVVVVVGGVSVVVIVVVVGVSVVVVVGGVVVVWGVLVVAGSIVLTGVGGSSSAAVVVLTALLVVAGALLMGGKVVSTGAEESSSEPLSLELQAAARTAITTTVAAAFDQLLRIIVDSLLRFLGGFGVTVRLNIKPTDYFCLLCRLETVWGLVFAHGMATSRIRFDTTRILLQSDGAYHHSTVTVLIRDRSRMVAAVLSSCREHAILKIAIGILKTAIGNSRVPCCCA